MENSPISLLDTLRIKTGCSYLSDLALPAFHKHVLSALDSIPAKNYNLADWQEAYVYILQHHDEYADAVQTRQALIDGLASA